MFIDVQRSGRIIADILEMFAPAQTQQSDHPRSRMPPYGINRRQTEEERLGVGSDRLVFKYC